MHQALTTSYLYLLELIFKHKKAYRTKAQRGSHAFSHYLHIRIARQAEWDKPRGILKHIGTTR